MSGYYDNAQKWQLYIRHRRECTLTQLQEDIGITDKSLREWFRFFDTLLAQYSEQNLRTMQAEICRLRKLLHQSTWEQNILKSAITKSVPEFTRYQIACIYIPSYGPNLICRLFGVRKSNFFYPDICCRLHRIL